MPACFTLTRKGESKPAILQEIDDEMRVEFGEEPDPEQWLWGWYDTIGYGLALGRDWAQLREQFAEDPAESERTNMFRRRMLAVIYWLEANYIPNAWAEVGKR
jgi:hypothetical protein